jgi:virginiamycin A acetyltransferase
LSGVKIGNGAIVASGCIISRDVPSYSIVAGNPARVIRSRFEEKDILKLNELCWWNWDKEQILANSDLLSSKNLNTFLRKNK